MPIATPEVYAEMLGRAKEHSFAFPAINCTSSKIINAALKGFADAGSDGIIQFSTGGAEFGSGLGIKDMVTGAVALAEFAHVVAEKYPVTVALHTDHCPKDKLDTYVRPLLAISQERVADGGNPLFQSHMWDGSAVPIDENLTIAKELLDAGGRREDRPRDRDRRRRRRRGRRRGRDQREALHHRRGLREDHRGARRGRARASTCWPRRSATCTASTSRATSSCAPTSSPQGQKVAAAKLGLADDAKPFDFVFHGGSGSLKSEIEESLRYGVVKMNVDTDTQYAFTRPSPATCSPTTTAC